MKTPRQILFERHRAVKPKLDEIRESTLAHLAPVDKRNGEERDVVTVPAWRVMFLSLRCHIAGMSAIWFLAIFLNIDFSSVSNGNVAHQPIARKKAPSPQQVVTALLENRRQIAELTASSANGNPPPVHAPESFIPPRRSEFSSPTEMA
jgi:hypothetical protein